MQNLLQVSQDKVAAFGLLQLKRLIEQVPLPKMLDHKIKKVDVCDAQLGLMFWYMVEQKRDMLPHPSFLFGRVVEDEERDLVAQAASAEEVIGRHPWQQLIEAFFEIHDHVPTWMQRRTYCSLR